MGALLEAARLKAESLGFELTYTPASTPPRSDLLEAWIEVRLSPMEPTQSPLLAMLDHRHSYRGRFHAGSVSAAQLATLEGLSTRYGQVHTTSDAERIAELARLARQADQIRAENQPSHEAMHRWLRWTTTEVERTRDGLDVRTLGLSAMELAAVRFLRPWKRMRRLLPFGSSKVQGRYGERMMRQTPGLGWIVAPTLERDELVQTGIVMQRVWLSSTQMGLALSPLSVLALLPLMASTDDPMLSTAHRHHLKIVHANLRRVLDIEGTKQVVFFFRIGRAETPSRIRALRRDFHDLLIEADTQN